MHFEPDDPGDMIPWYRLIPQPSPSASIWRYMDFTKFMSLLESSSLYFSRIDLLGDPYEATVPHTHSNRFQEIVTNAVKQDQVRSNISTLRTYLFVSCWHLGEYEDAALWRLYGQQHRSIAIRSDYLNLKSLPRVQPGQVTYLDYSKECIPTSPLEVLAMHKRHYFQSEREARALLWRWPPGLFGEDGQDENLSPTHLSGLHIPVQLSNFIHEIVVAPTADDWFYELTCDIVKRYGLHVPVRRSEMTAMPSLDGVGLPMDASRRSQTSPT